MRTLRRQACRPHPLLPAPGEPQAIPYTDNVSKIYHRFLKGFYIFLLRLADKFWKSLAQIGSHPVFLNLLRLPTPYRSRPVLQGQIKQLVNLNAPGIIIILQVNSPFLPFLRRRRVSLQPFFLFRFAFRRRCLRLWFVQAAFLVFFSASAGTGVVSPDFDCLLRGVILPLQSFKQLVNALFFHCIPLWLLKHRPAAQHLCRINRTCVSIYILPEHPVHTIIIPAYRRFIDPLPLIQIPDLREHVLHITIADNVRQAGIYIAVVTLVAVGLLPDKILPFVLSQAAVQIQLSHHPQHSGSCKFVAFLISDRLLQQFQISIVCMVKNLRQALCDCVSDQVI